MMHFFNPPLVNGESAADEQLALTHRALPNHSSLDCTHAKNRYQVLSAFSCQGNTFYLLVSLMLRCSLAKPFLQSFLQPHGIDLAPFSPLVFDFNI